MLACREGVHVMQIPSSFRPYASQSLASIPSWGKLGGRRHGAAKGSGGAMRCVCVCLRQRRLVVCPHLLLEKIMEAVGVCLCGCREGLVEPSDWLADPSTLRWPASRTDGGLGEEGRRGGMSFSNMQREGENQGTGHDNTFLTSPTRQASR